MFLLFLVQISALGKVSMNPMYNPGTICVYLQITWLRVDSQAAVGSGKDRVQHTHEHFHRMIA